jgi:ABC-type Zn uptake system ZnuABC Zn-binding protein ZnuA
MNTRRRTVALLFLASFAGAAGLSGCARDADPWEGKPGPPRVVVSFPPLYSFVKTVGGKHVGAISLCTTTGPHQYKYNPADTACLKGADLLFSNGLALDDRFTDRLQINCGNARLRHVKLGEHLKSSLLLDFPKGERREQGEEEDEHGLYDPHVWLGIDQARAMVEQIRDELVKADEAHTKDYEENAEKYLKKLDKLHKGFAKELADKKNKKIVTFHDSLRYFARSFGLEIAQSFETGPGDDPAAKRMTELVDLCLKDKPAAIAVEPQYATTPSAEVLLRELQNKKAKTRLVEIDPLETATREELESSDDWYFFKMRENLRTLVKQLP